MPLCFAQSVGSRMQCLDLQWLAGHPIRADGPLTSFKARTDSLGSESCHRIDHSRNPNRGSQLSATRHMSGVLAAPRVPVSVDTLSARDKHRRSPPVRYRNHVHGSGCFVEPLDLKLGLLSTASQSYPFLRSDCTQRSNCSVLEGASPSLI